MRLREITHRLYTNQISIDFVGKWKTWYTIAAIVLTLTIGGLVLRGVNWGIEFRGGAEYQFTGGTCTVEEARDAVEPITGQAIVTQLGVDRIRVQTEDVEKAVSDQAATALAETCDVALQDITINLVGPTWGADVSQKALQGLIVFLILVTIFLAVYFDWRMAVAAMVALIHDLMITIGVYALSGFEVTPATAIGILTILAFSLYDTVIVFDKVKENTAGILGQSRQTYAEAANLAVNQTLVRSINTTIVAVLPIGAILVVGVGLLGAGTLKDLALALFVGTLSGIYSSVFIATPLLVQLQNRRPEVQALERRVLARRKKGDEPAVHSDDAGDDGDGRRPQAQPGRATSTRTRAASRPVAETGQRQQPRRQSRSKRKR